ARITAEDELRSPRVKEKNVATAAVMQSNPGASRCIDSVDANHQLKPSEAHNPYLAARREWDERYGHLISRERNWRRMALLCGVTTLIAIGAIVRLSVRSHVVPFVVAIDALGRTAAAGPAEQAAGVDDRLKRAALFSWVGDLRMVTTDGIAQ